MPSTFRPERLRPSDCVENLPRIFNKFYCRPESKPALTSIGDQHIGASIEWVEVKPPTPCKGFLYYHAPKPATPLAGTMRFRLTPDFDPASGVSPQSAFAAGSDLLIPDAGDLPWSVPIWSIAPPMTMAPVCAVLRADGHTVPNSPDTKKKLTKGCLTLYALGQPFLVEFHMHTVRVWFLTNNGANMTCGRIQTGFVDLANKKFRSPYTGPLSAITFSSFFSSGYRNAGMGIMTLDRLDNGILVTRLQKILSLTQVYVNEHIPPPVEGMTRELQLAPILFKESTKSTNRKYKGSLDHLRGVVAHLPHVSELHVGEWPLHPCFLILNLFQTPTVILNDYESAANPTASLSKSKTLYTFFRKLPPSSHTSL